MNNGKEAEKLAGDFLSARGLNILASNFTSPYGEIDLIAKQDSQLVFVEVRLRHNSGFGQGFETVTRQKQQKIIRTAQYFLQQNKIYQNLPCRFDIVSLHSLKEQEHAAWIQDAFQT